MLDWGDRIRSTQSKTVCIFKVVKAGWIDVSPFVRNDIGKKQKKNENSHTTNDREVVGFSVVDRFFVSVVSFSRYVRRFLFHWAKQYIKGIKQKWPNKLLLVSSVTVFFFHFTFTFLPWIDLLYKVRSNKFENGLAALVDVAVQIIWEKYCTKKMAIHRPRGTHAFICIRFFIIIVKPARIFRELSQNACGTHNSYLWVNVCIIII